jgi:2-hydroxychromene-2-carboxylate isomerase
MTLKRAIQSRLMRLFASSQFRNLKRRWSGLKRKLMRAEPTVHFFCQLDDPYSYLLAQQMLDVKNRYAIDLKFHLVSQPSDAAAPERAALEAYSLKDAKEIAPFYKLKFPNVSATPSHTSFQIALRALVAHASFNKETLEIMAQYWANDTQGLKKRPLFSAGEAESRLQEDTELRDSLGHYLGGTLYFEGEWYWGIDRLPYLEDRLTKAKLKLVGAKNVSHFQKRPTFMSKPAKRRLTVEFYPSIRSPYSYLAMPEMMDLPNHYPVNVVWRPVMPMVMRGLPVPPNKGFYIIQDAKREADRIGVPFGNICDPVGTPVRRGFSLFPYANALGRGPEYLYAFCQLAWSEGRDMSRDQNLKLAIERAGLDWDGVGNYLDNPAWEDEIEANRVQVMKSGLWGVPSYRLLGARGREIYAGWGRDRIWLLAQYIQDALSE